MYGNMACNVRKVTLFLCVCKSNLSPKRALTRFSRIKRCQLTRAVLLRDGRLLIARSRNTYTTTEPCHGEYSRIKILFKQIFMGKHNIFKTLKICLSTNILFWFPYPAKLIFPHLREKTSPYKSHLFKKRVLYFYLTRNAGKRACTSTRTCILCCVMLCCFWH